MSNILAEAEVVWTGQFILMFISAIALAITGIIGAYFSAKAANRADLSVKASHQNALNIAENTRITEKAQQDVVGHVMDVAKSVNGQIAKSMEVATTAAHAEGVLEEKEKTKAITAAHELGRLEGTASANVIPPTP